MLSEQLQAPYLLSLALDENLIGKGSFLHAGSHCRVDAHSVIHTLMPALVLFGKGFVWSGLAATVFAVV